jgi:putative peptidoglycan lipid II flippase
MLDWGLRLVVLLAVPCAVALLTFATPLVATLFHHGAFTDSDVSKIAHALGVRGRFAGAGGHQGAGAGLLRQPGHPHARSRLPWWCWCSRSCSTWPWCRSWQHAGLALSIGLGALVNATVVAGGAARRGSYRPQPGWGTFCLAGGGRQCPAGGVC